MSFTVSESDLPKARRAVEALSRRIGAKGVNYDRDIAKISIVGVGMRSHSGVAYRMFKALADSDVNIEMISTSEIKISVVIRKARADQAVKALHRAFGLGGKGR